MFFLIWMPVVLSKCELKYRIFEAEQALAQSEQRQMMILVNEPLSWWEKNYLIYFLSISSISVCSSLSLLYRRLKAL